MTRRIEKLFRAPYAVPNGMQLTEEGLWLADQITDRAALVDVTKHSDYYGTPHLIREIPSDSSNTSGLTYGEGALWFAANGSAELFRLGRPNDAQKEKGEVLKVDPETGETLGRYLVPGGGGIHGIEYDLYEPGMLWLTTLKSQTLTKMRLADWSVQHVLPLPYKRAHGVVRVPDGIWVVHTADRVIVKLDVSSGAELDRIDVPTPHPEPHCLSIFGEDLLYCDASSGWVVEITL
jgi:streptogramin lyase